MIETYGKYTIIALPITKNHYKYTCRCECGNIKEVYKYDLISGRSTQCKSCQISEAQTKHGLSLTKPYQVWNDIKARCYNENCKAFLNYGNRGIQMCSEWKDDFLSFNEWFKTSGYKKGLSIDRINNNGHYTPSNCRWVTPKENNNNKGQSFEIQQI